MNCASCDQELDSRAIFCSKCGSAVDIYVAGLPTAGIAVAALISVFFVPVLGIVLGYVARSEIKNSRGTKVGRGLATAAIVLGWVFSISYILFFVIWIALLLASTPDSLLVD